MSEQTIIERGFTIDDLNYDRFKVVTIEKESKDGKKEIRKNKKIKFDNLKLKTIGFVKTYDDPNCPDCLKGIEVFEIPNPYNFEFDEFKNYGWNIEQAILALKEGYADGFTMNNNIFGFVFKCFKCLNPDDALKVKEYYLKEYSKWIKAIDKTPFTYVSIIRHSTRDIEIGISLDEEDDINNPENKTDILNWLISEDKKCGDFSEENDYESIASKILEFNYYCQNFLNLAGTPVAKYLEYPTMKKAKDFAEWLRREGGAYDDKDNYIGSGAKLVNHGFVEWLYKTQK